jgi:hypothetical protein
MTLTENMMIAVLALAATALSFCLAVAFFTMPIEARLICIMFVASTACITMVWPDLSRRFAYRDAMMSF